MALFAKFIPTQSISTAATDGKDIFYNADFLQSLPTPQQDGLILHEVLHAALLHVLRRGLRDKTDLEHCCGYCGQRYYLSAGLL